MKHLMIVRSGGALATGTIACLHNVGCEVLVLEKPRPSALRREAAFADAVYDGVKTVERITCRCAANWREADSLLRTGAVTMLVDPAGRYIHKFRSHILVDSLSDDGEAMMHPQTSAYTIGLGPRFCAGQDVDCVIETMRGHNLGRIIYEGRASRGQGMASIVNGLERILRAPVGGTIEIQRNISSVVRKGDVVAEIYNDRSEVVRLLSPLDGVLRGAIHNGYVVTPGLPVAEIDPRTEPGDCFTISDRSRCIAGSVLEAILAMGRKRRH
jgi:xanthine dehydrogenase accessory factor